MLYRYSANLCRVPYILKYSPVRLVAIPTGHFYAFENKNDIYIKSFGNIKYFQYIT